MSIPKRHHYVPRVHIRHFKKDTGYYLCLKDRLELKKPASSSDFFVKNQLNSLGTEDGSKDHSSFENDLTKKWDDNFNRHYKNIVDCLESPQEIDHNTLLFFFEYGIIAFMRRLKMESNFNEEFLSFKEVIPDFVEVMDSDTVNFGELSEDQIKKAKQHILGFFDEIDKLDEKQKNAKYPALIPSEAKILLPKKCHCVIYQTESDSFILPDCSINALKSNETFNYHGTVANKLAVVGLPLTPKIYIEIRNSDVIGDQINLVHSPKNEKVKEINSTLFEIAYSQVLVNNESQFEEFKEYIKLK